MHSDALLLSAAPEKLNILDNELLLMSYKGANKKTQNYHFIAIEWKIRK